MDIPFCRIMKPSGNSLSRSLFLYSKIDGIIARTPCNHFFVLTFYTLLWERERMASQSSHPIQAL